MNTLLFHIDFMISLHAKKCVAHKNGDTRAAGSSKENKDHCYATLGCACMEVKRDLTISVRHAISSTAVIEGSCTNVFIVSSVQYVLYGKVALIQSKETSK